jgi:tRNA(Ile)-lysidine synthetase-like protein
MSELMASDAWAFVSSGQGAGALFAVFDADALKLPLSVHGSGRGRSFVPFGMDGRRKVRGLLAEAGVPRAERAAYPVVLDGLGTPLWLPGIRASAAAPLTTSSERAVMLYTVAALGYDPAALEMDS